VRLWQIKMAGFKSFVDPTIIHFPSDLVGIVGPNGCGKSNIIDAVRWVMGETSRHLRGESHEDVIFNGSNARKPVGQASIELVFDNSSGRVGGQYAQYNEIAVRRSVARDGQSKYFLNGGQCRRRDVIDIFLDTGLGPRSYGIIEQGMISRLIEARPEDLRVYIEEAAGISKYKHRRRETEQRIRHARENLSRLNDLREEVEKQLNHLQRQAKFAERFQALKKEARAARATLLALRLQMQEQEAHARERMLVEQQTHLEQTIAELRAIEAEIEQLRARHAEASDTFNDVQGHYYTVGGDIARAEHAIQHQKILRDRQRYELDQLQQVIEAAEAEAQRDRERETQLARDIAADEPRLEALHCALHWYTKDLMGAEQVVAEWQAQSEDLTSRAAGPAQAIKIESTRIEHLERQLAQLNQRLTRFGDEQQRLDENGPAAEIEKLRARATESQAQIEAQHRQLQDTVIAITERREHARQLGHRLDETRRRLQQIGGRLSSLEALQEAALGKHQQAIIEWLAHAGLDPAPRLAERLNVEAGWERAFETVLGPSLEAVCVGTIESALAMLGALPQGCVHLLEAGVSNTASPATLTPGRLLSKAVAPCALEDILTPIYVAADLQQALSLREQLGPGESVVTADGVWIGRQWLRVACESDERGGVLARESEINLLREETTRLSPVAQDLQMQLHEDQKLLKTLEQSREQLQAWHNQAHRAQAEIVSALSRQQQRLEQISARKAQLSEELREVQEHLEREAQERQVCVERRNQAAEAAKILEDERKALDAKRTELHTQLGEARTRARDCQTQAHELALRLEGLRTAHTSTRQALERIQARLEHLQVRRRDLSESLAQAIHPLQALQDNLTTILSQRLEVERNLRVARAAMQAIENELRERDRRRLETGQRLELVRAELDARRMGWQDAAVRCETLREQFEETGLERNTVLAALSSPGASVEFWQSRVENLDARIERLGAINLAAIDEFQQQSRRKDYLDCQHADLTEALATLENAIYRIDRETRSRFKETFDRVNTRLQEMFPRLFGGGQAHLEMTDNDWLTTGIAIMARPPGKRLSTIHLMSGGEKALAAVALIFAIFELNPAPFCMLDEVDAPLDDANVGRFCELVKEMSQRVQFIFITHNKATMEYAQHLVGVTMHEPGVSRLVAVDVEEAVEMATG
jgi:chromosome segregation protein